MALSFPDRYLSCILTYLHQYYDLP